MQTADTLALIAACLKTPDQRDDEAREAAAWLLALLVDDPDGKKFQAVQEKVMG